MILDLFAASFFVLCLFAALRDLSTLTIPNWLNAWIALLFIPAIIIALPGWEVAGWHLLAGFIAFWISVFLFMGGVIGGGDAKMIPGVVLWIGPAGVMPFVYGTALIGGVLVLLVLIARRTVPAYAAPGFAFETLQEKRGVPYGVAIAAGVIFAAPVSPLLTNLIS